MRSKALLLGHPLHPMLIPFPVAFLTGAFLFDAAGTIAGSSAWWTTGGHLGALGILAALLAAVPGFIDYLYTVPPASSGKTRATRHMAANLTAVALFAAAWLLRGGASHAPGLVPLALEAIGFGTLLSGAYMGGTLVTRNLISVDHRYAQAGKWQELTVPRGSAAIQVSARDELKVDQMKLVRIGDRRIVVARSERGYVAFDDRCTHRGGSLAGGVMICGTVQCLWHGSQFDVFTGKVSGGPAKKSISTYKVSEEDGRVLLHLDDA